MLDSDGAVDIQETQELGIEDHPSPEEELEQPPREECGVFGVWAPHEEVAKLAYYGLYTLQHRGQEAAGIAVGDGSRIVVYKDLGLVSQVFEESTLSSMTGHVAIGHCRYSTTGATVWENSQPIFRAICKSTSVTLGHNGNLVNTDFLHEYARKNSIKQAIKENSDSNVVTSLLAYHAQNSHEEDGVLDAATTILPLLKGAFCLCFMTENTLYAARDPQGFRPLVLGRLARGGWVVASESAALDIVGARMIREIEPGELVVINADGVKSITFAEPDPKGCIFEYVYLARPDTVIKGQSVQETRVEIGRRLAQENPVEADIVIPVPESGTPAAIGYAEASGITFSQGLMKNNYIGRTFIQPSQTIRQQGIRLKLNPLRSIIDGKRIVVVDDSIVRGNTQRQLVKLLREAGAREIHVRIASSPVRWPCFYGLDFATRAELIANSAGSDEMPVIVKNVCESIGADSLGYVSIDAMVAATEQSVTHMCKACFDGKYPVSIDHHVNDNAKELSLPLHPVEEKLNTSQLITQLDSLIAHQGHDIS